MDIQIASDLHLEFFADMYPGYLGIERTNADILVLAGDIHAGSTAFKAFADWPVPVVYVHGNHELYRGAYDTGIAELREKGKKASSSNIFFLENDELVIDGIRFLGCCLWTDYALYNDPQLAMSVAKVSLNDHAIISRSSKSEGAFAPEDALALHRQSHAWLKQKLNLPFSGKTVVVTHHCPHPGSVDPKFGRDPLNAAFASDLTPLVEKADLWIHGHTHSSFDYRVGKCRTVCNPAGYPLDRYASAADQVERENKQFNLRLVIAI